MILAEEGVGMCPVNAATPPSSFGDKGSIRGQGVSAVAWETLGKLLEDMGKSEKPSAEAALALTEYISSERHTLRGDIAIQFSREVHRRIAELTADKEMSKRLAGVRAISCLSSQNVLKLLEGGMTAAAPRIATCLHDCLENSSEEKILAEAAHALGNLAHAGGALVAEAMAEEIRRALHWLSWSKRIASRRIAAVHILRALANGLWDSSCTVRLGACAALRACLYVVEKRETRFRIQYHHYLFEESQKGLVLPTQGDNSSYSSQNPNPSRISSVTRVNSGGIPTQPQRPPPNSVESIHASLLVIGELFRSTRTFMLGRYKFVAARVLAFRNHKETIIRLTVAHLIPKLAAFSRKRFAEDHLALSVDHLLGMVRNAEDKVAGFRALFEMAEAVESGLKPHLESIISVINGIILPQKRGKAVIVPIEALKLIGSMISVASPNDIKQFKALIPGMVAQGLSPTLIETLNRLSEAYPSLKKTIRKTLLELLAEYLSHSPNYNSSKELSNSVAPLLDEHGEDQSMLLGEDSDGPPSDIDESTSRIGGPAKLGGDNKNLNYDRQTDEYDDHDEIRHMALLQELYRRDDSSLSTPFDEDSIEISNGVGSVFGDIHDKGERESQISKMDQTLSNIDSKPSGITSSSGLIRLALDTLGDFKLGWTNPDQLVQFTYKHILPWTSDENSLIRLEATRTIARVLFRSDLLSPSRDRKCREVAEELLDKIVTIAVTDADPQTRVAAIEALSNRSQYFDEHLCYAHRLTNLLLAIYDEHFPAKDLVIALVGRLADLNPAYVYPALRRCLVQHLSSLENSFEARWKEESAQLIGRLIRSCKKLIEPYVVPILRSLVAKLCKEAAADGEQGVFLCVLATVGDLAVVGGPILKGHLPELLPIIIDALHDNGSQIGPKKQEVAISALARLIESTGAVVQPYHDYPHLMPILLKLISSDISVTARLRTIKVLGCLGALDPHDHKRNRRRLLQGHAQLRRAQAQISAMSANSALNYERQMAGVPSFMTGCNKLAAIAASAQVAAEVGMGIPAAELTGSTSDGVRGVPMEVIASIGLGPSAEEAYPLIAINTLLGWLRDESITQQRSMVVRSLMTACKALGLNCTSYLPKIIPAFLRTLDQSEDSVKRLVLKSLAQLCRISKTHMRHFLAEIFDRLLLLWHVKQLLPSALMLVEDVAFALGDEFDSYIPMVIPRCVRSIVDAIHDGDFEHVPAILSAIQSLGHSLSECFHLIVPAISSLFRPGLGDIPNDVHVEALRTIGVLAPYMPLQQIAPSILHAMIRCLSHENEAITNQASETLGVIGVTMGSSFKTYASSIRRTMNKSKVAGHQLEVITGALIMKRNPREELASQQIPVPHVKPCAHRQRQSSQPFILDHGEDLGNISPPDALSPESGYEPTDFQNGHGISHYSLSKLKRAWECHHCVTKEDWTEWMRNFAVELIKESSSPAMRACAALAQVRPNVAKDLFAPAFFSCWSSMNPGLRNELVKSLENALASPSIPPDVVASILNLAEFMEHDENPLPVDIATLGAVAENCHAFAKALHYKELEFKRNSKDSAVVEALISINNHLHLPEAAAGILKYAQKSLNIELRETWHEKLQHWEDALDAYRKKEKVANAREDSQESALALLGQLRCFGALAEWDELANLASARWTTADYELKKSIAPLAAHAAWHLSLWEDMQVYVNHMHIPEPDNGRGRDSIDGMLDHGISLKLKENLSPESMLSLGPASDGAFFKAILCVREDDCNGARAYIRLAREQVWDELTALVSEGYDRSYVAMVRIQQLVELEEALEYRTLESPERRMLIRQMWNDRLQGAQQTVEVVQALLTVRSLALRPQEDVETWLKFAALCRKSNRLRQSYRTLVCLLDYDPLTYNGIQSFDPAMKTARLAYLKHLWATGDHTSALSGIRELVKDLDDDPNMSCADINGALPEVVHKSWMKLARWEWVISTEMTSDKIESILAAMRRATAANPRCSKAWRHTGLLNVSAMFHFAKTEPKKAHEFVAPAINAFFKSISFNSGAKESRLQDILRLLTLWFDHCDTEDVECALRNGFHTLAIDTWLGVIPQIIARISDRRMSVRGLIMHLLENVGKIHPQAIMFPILVAQKSTSGRRADAAKQLLESVESHHGVLVEQAAIVAEELIRIAILWHEEWYEALEEASRLYFGEGNVEGMFRVLQPLHDRMAKIGPSTQKEIAFVQAYGRELSDAAEICRKYQTSSSKCADELTQAWDLYYHVFKRINKQLPGLTTLELQSVSPRLVNVRNFELAVPGTYVSGQPIVTVRSFSPILEVMASKQRPRKLGIQGSDGVEHLFLLKGHEDLRQDERAMQLLALVNSLLATDRNTAPLDLMIQRYSVVPLSPNSGLIGWVPHCDTLHQLVKEYRETRHIPLNQEHKSMISLAPDYNRLPLMGKVEVFSSALKETDGEDLARVSWLKSRNSEVWLERRTNYTRSLATMSMVGYVLGLGDRHPSNLMLDRFSGKIMHIDFGDCFEVAMNREKYPEKVPFRLTRLLVKAMEVSGIEGGFRSTCTKVMSVLRSNKDSVMAMLEAFVHDPLINWRLLNRADPSSDKGEKSHMKEELNERAVAVMKRISSKLTGKDSTDRADVRENIADCVEAQVDRLIAQASSVENLCQSYIGWCPFW